MIASKTDKEKLRKLKPSSVTFPNFPHIPQLLQAQPGPTLGTADYYRSWRCVLPPWDSIGVVQLGGRAGVTQTRWRRLAFHPTYTCTDGSKTVGPRQIRPGLTLGRWPATEMTHVARIDAVVKYEVSLFRNGRGQTQSKVRIHQVTVYYCEKPECSETERKRRH